MNNCNVNVHVLSDYFNLPDSEHLLVPRTPSLPEHLPPFSANVTKSSSSHTATIPPKLPQIHLKKTRQLTSPRHDADLSQVDSRRHISNARVSQPKLKSAPGGGWGGGEAANKKGRTAHGGPVARRSTPCCSRALPLWTRQTRRLADRKEAHRFSSRLL